MKNWCLINRRISFKVKKYSFLINKYTVVVFIVLSYFAADMLLHKGMTRLLWPVNFTTKRAPQQFPGCRNQLVAGSKSWVKGVNTEAQLTQLPSNTSGFEVDVYFDTTKNTLLVYHDSAHYSSLSIEVILDRYSSRKLQANIWLDFKNLSAANEIQSIRYISYLRNKYSLRNKLIVEGTNPSLLQSFCDSGFFTSYYTAYFNPYQANEAALVHEVDSIAALLKRYRVCALSGYYFQYPMLKQYFPGYPILTWAEQHRWSLVSYLFNSKLEQEENVKVVLYNSK